MTIGFGHHTHRTPRHLFTTVRHHKLVVCPCNPARHFVEDFSTRYLGVDGHHCGLRNKWFTKTSGLVDPCGTWSLLPETDVSRGFVSCRISPFAPLATDTRKRRMTEWKSLFTPATLGWHVKGLIYSSILVCYREVWFSIRSWLLAVM